MSNYLIIDSNNLYAAKLYNALTGSDVDAGESIIDTTNFASASKVFDVVNPKIKDDSKKIILINAETELKDKYLQHQPIIELAFWIRCRYNSVNPIVFYSGVSVNHSLKHPKEPSLESDIWMLRDLASARSMVLFPCRPFLNA